MRYLFLVTLMMSSVAIASDLETAFDSFKKQFPDAQYYEKDVEGGEGGSIRLVFPIVESEDVPKEDPVTIADLDKAEEESTKEIAQFTFMQNSTNVSSKDSKQLDGLAQILLLHPEIAKVRIDVYGKDQEIAKKRASKICEYMMERGISSGRCETRSMIDKKEQVLRFFLLKE